MLQYGIVTEVDSAGCRARVTFEELDNLVSDFLPVLQLGTRTDKTYWLPDVNEHVACLMDSNSEAGVILGCTYNTEDKPEASLAGVGVRSLQVVKGTAAVFLASVRRAAGAFKLWAKGPVEVGSDAAVSVAAGTVLELSASGGKVKISQTGRLSYSANGGNLHKVLADIAQYLATHKHVVSGPATTVLSPDDLLKAAAIALEIEKIIEN